MEERKIDNNQDLNKSDSYHTHVSRRVDPAVLRQEMVSPAPNPLKEFELRINTGERHSVSFSADAKICLI